MNKQRFKSFFAGIGAIIFSFSLPTLIQTASATPLLVNFDDALVGSMIMQPFTTASDGGLTFTQNSGTSLFENSPPNTNSNVLVHGYYDNDNVTITRTDGGFFNLYSIDLVDTLNPTQAPGTLSVIGYTGISSSSFQFTLNGSFQTEHLNFLNVSSVVITGLTPILNGRFWALDNLQYDNVSSFSVPEPASITLLLSGLIGFSIIRLPNRPFQSGRSGTSFRARHSTVKYAETFG